MVAAIAFPPPVLLVWNTTASVPVGLYVVTRATLKRGDLLLIHLPPSIKALASSRRILSPNTPLLKPVAALVGDRVCRFGTAININGHHVAIARLLDRYGHTLPAWQGCRRLSPSEVFVLATHANSFDSRYCGPLPLHRALGVARALIVLPQ
jgi:type IV secretory pathway protease TraF